MPFRASIRFDFGTQSTNEYQKLVTAFIQAGWAYVQTSAVAAETDDVNVILRGLDILARQVPHVGTISALLVDVQRSDDFAGKPYKASHNHPNALNDIRTRPSPP